MRVRVGAEDPPVGSGKGADRAHLVGAELEPEHVPVLALSVGCPGLWQRERPQLQVPAQDDFAAEARQARPTVVLDFLWGATAEAAFAGLGRSGLDEDTTRTAYLELGQSAGASASVPGSLLRSSAITIRGSGAGSSPIAEIVAELPTYLDRIASGQVSVPVRTFPLSRVADAWQHNEPGVRAVVVA